MFSDTQDLVTSPSGMPFSSYGHSKDKEVQIEIVKFIQIPKIKLTNQQTQINLNRFRITQLRQESQGQFDDGNELAFNQFPKFTSVILTIDTNSVIRMFGTTT